MARPRTFDPDKVLDAAREIFWRKGYQATSLDDITEETGLTKPSLYAAFGDKTSLFLQVLERYHAHILARSQKILASEPSPRAAIEAWLTSFLPFCSGAKGRRGCLSINTGADGGLDEAALRKSIASFNTRLEELIVTRLQQNRDQFADDFDPVAAGRTIMAVYSGLLAQARQAPTLERVQSIVTQTMKLLA